MFIFLCQLQEAQVKQEYVNFENFEISHLWYPRFQDHRHLKKVRPPPIVRQNEGARPPPFWNPGDLATPVTHQPPIYGGGHEALH